MWTRVCLRPVLGFIWSVWPGLGLPDLGTDPNDWAVERGPSTQGWQQDSGQIHLCGGGVRGGNPFFGARIAGHHVAISPRVDKLLDSPPIGI